MCACVYLLMDHSIKAEIFVAFIKNKGYVYAVPNGMCHIYTYTSTPSLCVFLPPSLLPSLSLSLHHIHVHVHISLINSFIYDTSTRSIF